MRKYICMIGIMISVMLTSCGTEPTFNGSRTSDGTNFFMEYCILNRMESQDLEMKEGDIIDVEIVSDSGNLAVTIQKGDEDPIYSGNELPTSSFSVGVPKEGTYTITVTGKKAKGSVSFRIKEGEIQNADSSADVISDVEDVPTVPQAYEEVIGEYYTALEEQWDGATLMEAGLNYLVAECYQDNPLENIGLKKWTIRGEKRNLYSVSLL